ncbi:MAG TPA: hypothetical protein P5328_01495 [Candidatus Paceibacterota bacterium]|nr:hypothetical protein [Candidatus Paceibacterota bacterium]HRZ34689.1 hypothetical protein [Candidatus Paceibacterota bacterium]
MFENLYKKVANRLSLKPRGFTLLFAVLVSILILSVGISIINLSTKQIILSGSGRESQYAFYAANTGIECAYYFDWNPPEGKVVFPYNEDSMGLTPVGEGIKCAYRGTGPVERNLYDEFNEINGYAYADLPGMETEEGDDDIYITEFWLAFDVDLPYCAHVIVQKKYDDSGDSPVIKTQIDSYGYNTCDPDNPRRVERGLRVGSI